MRKFIPVLLAVACAIPAVAADLTVGDKAPPLKIAEWVKGEPVAELEQGRIYVVEFWATWCGPCIEGIPHLTELAKKFSEAVTVIGVNIWETREAADTSYFASVKSFVADMGPKMDYVVGIDGPGGDMAKTWMEAAGQHGIPSAFVVNGDGVIAWIGHPMSMDGVLEKVVAGTWDLDAAKRQAKDEQEVNALLDELYDEFGAARMDPTKASALADKLDNLIAAKPGMLPQLVGIKFEVLLETHPEKAMETARTHLKGELRDDVDFLMTVAMGILEKENKKLDYALGLSAARQFVEIVGAEDPFALDVLAMGHYRNGNYLEAIIIGEKAKSIVENDIEAMRAAGKDVSHDMSMIGQFLADRVEMYKKRGKD